MDTTTYLPGELLYRGNYTLIHRASAETGEESVLFHVPRRRDSSHDLAKLHREREVLALVGIESHLAYARGGSLDGVVGLATQDGGGEPLKSWIDRDGVDLADSLWIGLEIAKQLRELHDQRVIHKDVNPRNVLVDREARRATLMSYGIASRLPRETHAVVSPEVLEGQLLYISPEQTGRMNRAVDYRSDFYSLGVTLYEMLTGHLLSSATSPLEIVHSHIAHEPVPPCETNPRIPSGVSDIVMKLLMKNAEDRYQSSRGLIANLESCVASLETSGSIARFELGRSDRPDRFQVPQRLYGREREFEQLESAFERAGHGRAELLLLAGYPGIGKSVLVHEVDKLMVAKRGFLTTGKFEQFRRDVPYLAFAGAFEGLVRQLLTQSVERSAEWKARILNAVGDSGQVIIDVIPEVEHLVGPQPVLPELPPTESEALFIAVFQSFLRVFTQLDHTLVIFLDDLQWADPASLKLLKALLAEPDDLSLLLVGAYRNNEVDSAHRLSHFFQDLAKEAAPIEEITLGPLSPAHVAQLVADTLRTEVAPIVELADILYAKTGGNPFFLLQFFESLYDDGYLEYDERTRRWTWDRSRIETMESTANVVDLMVSKMKKLGTETQNALRHAAAIGAVFDLDTLATVTEQSRGEVAQHLWASVRLGQVVPLINEGTPSSPSDERIAHGSESDGEVVSFVEDLATNYRFLHDRVQQAAYSLTREPDRMPMHCRIGRLMWKSTPPEDVEERAFDIIHHMNLCTDLLETEADRRELAELNVLAANRASHSTAYTSALTYLKVASSLVSEPDWDHDYDFLFELNLRRAECEYLVGNFGEATELFDSLSERARDVNRRIEIFSKSAVLFRHAARYEDSLRSTIQGLALAGIEVPWHDESEQLAEIISADSERLRNTLEGRDIDALIDLPKMDDAVSLATMDLLAELSMGAYFFNPALLQLSTLKMVLLSLERGNARTSASAYATYGSTIASGLGLFEEGFKFCNLGLSLSRRVGDAGAESQVVFWFGATVHFWRAPVGESIELLKSGFELGMRVGAPNWATYCSFFVPVHTRFRGVSLQEYVDAHDRYIDVFKGEDQSLYAAIAYRKGVMCLTGELPGRYRLDGGKHIDGTEFVEDDFFREMVDEKGLTLSEQHYYNIKQLLAYVFGVYDEALAIFEQAVSKGAMADRLFGQLVNAEWLFYRALVLASLHDGVEPDTADAYEAEIKEHHQQLTVWAENCPSNFEAMRQLVAAELARIHKDWAETWALYDSAIESAHEHGFVNLEAIAAERTARYYLSRGRERVAQPYLQLARERFRQWGAEAKVEALEREFDAQLAAETDSNVVAGKSLDVGTVTKAYKALSREIMLDALIRRMLQIAIENAGARSGVLLLEQDGKVVITARGREDGEIETINAVPLRDFHDLPQGIVNYVLRTAQPVVLDEACDDRLFGTDPYVLTRRPRSILCVPVELQGELTALLYLENDLAAAAFTEERVELLKVLLAQAAISLENARLYASLEGMVAERTRELSEAVHALEARHKDLQQAQSQLVQAEKMASLGQLVAGIAHEINNPVNFISSGIPSLRRDIATVSDAVPQSERSPRFTKVQARIGRLVDAIADGASRTATIVKDLRSFSRLDEAELKKADIHEALDTTLTLLQSQTRDRIEVVKHYGEIPRIDCYISQVNQVFMNLLSNACQAIEGSGNIEISTARNDDDTVSVTIQDSGPGIPEDVLSRIFDPFFTTKEVGKGTGLGLSISQGIVEKHGGSIRIESPPGEGAKFVVTLPIDPKTDEA